MLRSFFALAALTVLPLAAQADESSTNLACQGAGEMAVQVEVSELSASSYMQIAGIDIPALRSCMGWAHGNPRMGGSWRCPHGALGSDVRYEIYPIMRPTNGDNAYVRIVKWDGDRASKIDLKDCE